MSAETILTNAHLVLPDATLSGSIVIRGDVIAAVQPGRAAASSAIDLDGDYLIPGVVDVHTDNLERQVQPRSLARWPSSAGNSTGDGRRMNETPSSLIAWPRREVWAPISIVPVSSSAR